MPGIDTHELHVLQLSAGVAAVVVVVVEARNIDEVDLSGVTVGVAVNVPMVVVLVVVTVVTVWVVTVVLVVVAGLPSQLPSTSWTPGSMSSKLSGRS